mmetsp:Transcript_2752/g.9317  ORF Transcript_2752/g.9317 Transcript_2752/m.9317 type:complete len:297 (+) Transcript_2752:918-1808(+)
MHQPLGHRAVVGLREVQRVLPVRLQRVVQALRAPPREGALPQPQADLPVQCGDAGGAVLQPFEERGRPHQPNGVARQLQRTQCAVADEGLREDDGRPLPDPVERQVQLTQARVHLQPPREELPRPLVPEAVPAQPQHLQLAVADHPVHQAHGPSPGDPIPCEREDPEAAVGRRQHAPHRQRPRVVDLVGRQVQLDERARRCRHGVAQGHRGGVPHVVAREAQGHEVLARLYHPGDGPQRPPDAVAGEVDLVDPPVVQQRLAHLRNALLADLVLPQVHPRQLLVAPHGGCQRHHRLV